MKPEGRPMNHETTPPLTAGVVYLALLALLGLTLAAAEIELGSLGPVVALSIALAKTVLIGVYFMHLRGSGLTARTFALVGLLWLVLLLTFVFGDYLNRTEL